MDSVGDDNRIDVRGRKKAIWISEAADLYYDCRRDLKDIGFGNIPVANLRDLPYGSVVVQKTYMFWIPNNVKKPAIQRRSAFLNI